MILNMLLISDEYSVSIKSIGNCHGFTSKCIFDLASREFILRLKIKRNDWMLADTCPQAANHCA